MRPISCVLCAILALLTVLSIIPVFLSFWVCEFSEKCVLQSFGHAMALRGIGRTLAIVTLLGPFFALLAYTSAFLNCYKKRDVLDRGDHLFGCEDAAKIYSFTGIHISRPPLPVSGSKFSS